MTTKPHVPISEQLALHGVTMKDVGLASDHKARKPRKEPLGDLRAAPEGTQVRVGYFGAVRHIWRFDAHTGSWLSGCKRIQRSEIVEELPEGLEAGVACECLSREVQE